MMHHKNEIRQSIRAKRKALSIEQQHTAAEQICEHVLQLNRYRLSQHIAFYLSVEAELNPENLLLQAHQAGKQCYLPVLHTQKINTLIFLPYMPGDKLIPNRYGILEPVIHDKHMPAWQLDLVFMPLVAFDQKCNRLGMGKGYYDRTFEFLHKNSRADKPYLVGLAYQMQQVDHLHAEAHDIPLNMIITEKGVFSA